MLRVVEKLVFQRQGIPDDIILADVGKYGTYGSGETATGIV